VDFDQAFDRLLGNEGGYTNDPHDPGGETNWGITIEEARRHGYNGPMKDLPKNVAKQIYREDYWDVLGDVNPAVKFQAFDFGVNAGISTSIRKLQAAIGVADDGRWGPVSAAKLKSMDVNDVLMRFAAQRLYFYTSLSKWQYFGKGWTRRIANDLNLAAEDN
jgi:lysozyme family protein